MSCLTACKKSTTESIPNCSLSYNVRRYFPTIVPSPERASFATWRQDGGLDVTALGEEQRSCPGPGLQGLKGRTGFPDGCGRWAWEAHVGEAVAEGEGEGEAEVVVDTVTEAEAEAAAEVAPEVAAEVAPEVVPEVAPEVAVEVAAEVVVEVAVEVAAVVAVQVGVEDGAETGRHEEGSSLGSNLNL